MTSGARRRGGGAAGRRSRLRLPNYRPSMVPLPPDGRDPRPHPPRSPGAPTGARTPGRRRPYSPHLSGLSKYLGPNPLLGLGSPGPGSPPQELREGTGRIAHPACIPSWLSGWGAEKAAQGNLGTLRWNPRLPLPGAASGTPGEKRPRLPGAPLRPAPAPGPVSPPRPGQCGRGSVRPRPRGRPLPATSPGHLLSPRPEQPRRPGDPGPGTLSGARPLQRPRPGTRSEAVAAPGCARRWEVVGPGSRERPRVRGPGPGRDGPG